jgi:Phage integrase family
MPRRVPPLAAPRLRHQNPEEFATARRPGCIYLRVMRIINIGSSVFLVIVRCVKWDSAPPLGRALFLWRRQEIGRGSYTKPVRDGLDPLDKRDADKVKARLEASIEASKNLTFDEFRDAYIAAHEASWRNAKHRSQWLNTLQTYASPCFGHIPVGAVNVGFVMAVLDGIWTNKPETASRVRGRIESVLDWASARGYRTGENPARWASLKYMLPARSKIAGVKHHAALPFRDIGDFMTSLRGRSGTPARAVEYIILTAARSGEVRNATWAEIDLEARLWVIPASHTKTNREHRVPLSQPALAVLEGMARLRTDNSRGLSYSPARVRADR